MSSGSNTSLLAEIRERQAKYMKTEWREQNLKEYLVSVRTQINEFAALGFTQKALFLPNPSIAGIEYHGRMEALEAFLKANGLGFKKYIKYSNKTTMKKIAGEIKYIKYIVYFDGNAQVPGADGQYIGVKQDQ